MRTIAAILLLTSINAFADCDSVIALSKTSSSTFVSKKTFDQQAKNFCSEYSQSQSSGGSAQGGGSYGLFSASAGMTNQSASAVASKYCSNESKGSANDSAYSTYAENISADAYNSYNQCVALSKKNVRFDVDQNAVLPNQFSISAFFVSNANDSKVAEIDISASDGIQCSSSGAIVTSVKIRTGSSASINCRRADRTQKGFVKFMNTKVGDGEGLTLPWQIYDSQGNTINTIQNLEKRLIEVESRSVASGSVGMKAVNTRPINDSSQCPASADAYRGEINGRVDFPKPFLTPPIVHIGIAAIDIGNEPLGQRLTVSVNKVDNSGFNYSFTTWCTTPISGATATWLAVSK